MRDADVVRQVSLKSKLLAGAVGLTAAAMSSAALADGAPAQGSSAAPPSDPPKWTPYAEVGGGLGSGYTVGNVDIMAPIYQNLDSLLFVHLDAGTESTQHQFYGFGAGYRTKIDPNWILGVYANYDSSETTYSHTFNQGQLGAELMSTDWDVRVNGYLADSGAQAISNKYELYIHDTEIAILQGEEAAYSGFDGEVGYRVFSLPDTDVRLFAGGFMFTHGSYDATSMGRSFDTGFRSMSGPKARAEVTLYDLDAVALQSRLSFEAEVAHDEVRGTTGFVGAVFRIPLHPPDGPGAQALDELDRRMVDPERRQDNVLTRWQFAKPEPVVVYGQHFRSQPTNTLYYVDNTKGEGSYANPTTLSDATSRPGENAVIVITSKQGTVTGDGVMQAGQTMIGGGETFGVEGTVSHAKFIHDFAPGTTDPTVAPAADGDDVITVADKTVVYGFSITGDFGNAIYGHNVDNVNIGDMTINGGGSGGTGVYIKNDAPGTSDIYIYHTAVADVAEDGIAIDTDLKSSGTLKESDVLTNDSVTDAGFEGIHIFSYAGDAPSAVVDQYVGIHNATVADSGLDNIRIQGSAGAGGTVTQNFVVDPTSTSGGTYGIAFDADAFGGGRVGQYGTLTDFTATGQVDDGVLLDADADAGGRVVQNFAFSGITVTDAVDASKGNGLRVYGYSYAGGFVHQTLTVNGLTATDNAHDGVLIDAETFSDNGNSATVEQYVSITNATIDGNGQNGVDIIAHSKGVGYTGQDVKVISAYIEGNGQDGIRAVAYADFGGAAVQYMDFVNDIIAYNGRDGVHLEAVAKGYSYGAGASGSFVGQYAALVDDDIYLNGRDGVHIYRNASYGHFVSGHPCASSQEGGGECAIVAQTVDIAISNVVDNGRDGIYLATLENGYGAVYSEAGRPSHTPTLLITGSDVSDNGKDGLEIENEVLGYSYLYQYVKAGDTHFDHNAGFGIYGKTIGAYGSFIAQLVTLYGYHSGHTTVSNNAAGGIELTANTYGAYSVGSGMVDLLTVADSQIENNGGNGVEMFMYTKGTYFTLQGMTLDDNLIANNAGYGAKATAYGIGDFIDAQSVTVADNLFAANGSQGLSVVQKDVSYETSQSVIAEYNAFDDNGAGGFSQAQYLYGTRSGTQAAFVKDNYFSGPGNAISVKLVAYGVGGHGTDNYATTHQYIAFNELKNIGGDGIDISVTSMASPTDPSVVFNSTVIELNTLNDVGGDGISVDLTATGNSSKGREAFIYADTSYNKQAIEIVGNEVYHTGGNGIGVELTASYDGVIYHPSSVTTPFSIEIDGNSVNYTGGDGIALSMNTLDGGIGAYFDIGAHLGNLVQNTAGYGIAVRTSNRYDIMFLSGAIDNNFVNKTGLGGITVNNYELSGVTGVSTYLGHNHVYQSAAFAGINIVDKGYGGGLLDSAKIYNNVTNHNAHAGIGLYAYGNSAGQADYVGSNTASGNIYGVLGIANGSASQFITVYSLGNTVSGNTTDYHFTNNGTGIQFVH